MRFKSFFLGGFECSSHRRFDGRRLDLIASTGHDAAALADFTRLRAHGVLAARDGARWHLVESQPGRRDWSSLDRIVEAAERADIDVIWDLCHYGWPDWLDIWSNDFPARFADFAAAAAQRIATSTGRAPVLCAINEISFWAWAGGDMGFMNPMAKGRGGALKQQLVVAALAATRAIRADLPRARFTSSEPLIHVAAGAPERGCEAQVYELAQFEATDLWLGRGDDDFGGFEDALDWIGVNFYPHNQWIFEGPTIPFGHCRYRPLSALLVDVWERYRKPILITETGAEGSARAAWLHYVCDEVRRAMALGAPIEGICLYPIVDYPGWDNDRLCPVGLFSEPRGEAQRDTHAPLADELRRQIALFSNVDARPGELACALA